MRLRRGTAAAAWFCGCGVEGVEHGGAWSTEARVAGVMAARARVRRRRRSARAALGEREGAAAAARSDGARRRQGGTVHGGTGARLWRGRTAAAQGEGGVEAAAAA